MKIHKGHITNEFINPVVTIGMFDGVHLGHISLLNTLKTAAKRLNCQSVVVSFEPHPQLVIAKKNEQIKLLSSFDEKVRFFHKAGIDHFVILPFTVELSKLSATEFVEKVLIGKINLQHLIVGFNHRFGTSNKKHSDNINELSERYGFGIEHIEAYEYEGKPVSSSLIRNLLHNGEIDKANRMLDKAYTVSGTIVEGLKLGKVIGYPTANLKPDCSHKLIPQNGVYAGRAKLKKTIYKCMIYIGTRPTINETDRIQSIEANLLDFEGDIYGEAITLFFIDRVRGDIKFENRKLLIEQIKKDKELILKILA